MSLEGIDLDLSAAVGSMKSICTVEIVGVLEPEDVAGVLRGAQPRDGTLPLPGTRIESEDPRDLKKIREKHHSVARLIASGLTQRMVAQLSGYSESYVSILLGSPAMVELVDLYRTNYTSSATMIGERLQTAAGSALDKILEKLDGEEEHSIPDLVSIAKLGFDRSGHGPSSKQHVVQETHLFDHAELQARDRAARSASAVRIIEHKPTPSPSTPQLPPASDAA